VEVDAPRTAQALTDAHRLLPAPVEVAVPVSFALPPEFVEAVAQRAADLLADRMAAPVEPWIGVDDAAAHLACSTHRVYRLVAQARNRRTPHDRRIPHHHEGQRLLFRRSELDAWAGRGGGPGR
jgi:hypothetical protein